MGHRNAKRDDDDDVGYMTRPLIGAEVKAFLYEISTLGGLITWVSLLLPLQQRKIMRGTLQLSAGLAYTTCKIAFDEMTEKAQQFSANAVLGIDIDYKTVGGQGAI